MEEEKNKVKGCCLLKNEKLSKVGIYWLEKKKTKKCLKPWICWSERYNEKKKSALEIWYQKTIQILIGLIFNIFIYKFDFNSRYSVLYLNIESTLRCF